MTNSAFTNRTLSSLASGGARYTTLANGAVYETIGGIRQIQVFASPFHFNASPVVSYVDPPGTDTPKKRGPRARTRR